MIILWAFYHDREWEFTVSPAFLINAEFTYNLLKCQGPKKEKGCVNAHQALDFQSERVLVYCLLVCSLGYFMNFYKMEKPNSCIFCFHNYESSLWFVEWINNGFASLCHVLTWWLTPCTHSLIGCEVYPGVIPGSSRRHRRLGLTLNWNVPFNLPTFSLKHPLKTSITQLLSVLFLTNFII